MLKITNWCMELHENFLEWLFFRIDYIIIICGFLYANDFASLNIDSAIPFHVFDLFLYPLKSSKSLWFSDILRGYRRRPVPWNRFKKCLLKEAIRLKSAQSKGNKSLLASKILAALNRKFVFIRCKNSFCQRQNFLLQWSWGNLMSDKG